MALQLANSFTDSFKRLSGAEQKAVKASVFDLQMDDSGEGLQLHRITKSKDANFWSARVNRDLRLILHKRGGSTLVAYVGHHDDAYRWAERRRIEVHPKTHALQIVEVRERVEEIPVPAMVEAPPVTPEPAPLLFAALDDEALLSVGVPQDWLADVRAADEDRFFALAVHLPEEAMEALLEYATSGKLPKPRPAPADPLAHPDTARRILMVRDDEELEQALNFPWEKWGIFLHPSQRALVEKRFAGPARVSGSAGTGKTVVAIHRAVHLARANPEARILLASFSRPLADDLARRILVLAPETGGIVPRITSASFEGIAEELYQLEYGVRPRIVPQNLLREWLQEAARELETKGFSLRFLLSEWTHVIDAWGVADSETYEKIPRMGRKSRLGPKARQQLWPLFADILSRLQKERYTSWANVFTELAALFQARDRKPFQHILIDEAQDLSPAELRFFASLAPKGPDNLFLSGDIGQRIFRHPFAWSALGVDVRGRSHRLQVCYRNSQQIRRMADRLLPPVLHDGDGVEDERRGVVSVFGSVEPAIRILDSKAEEAETVARHVSEWLESGIVADEIGIMVRVPDLVARAKAAIAEVPEGRNITVIPMHLTKGLEFRAVAVMACDEGVLPLDARVADAADEAELDDIYETERRLLYVACTRARERLLVTGVKPASVFLDDLA